MEPEFFIRPAAEPDLPGINAILTHYALKTVVTFATAGPTDEALRQKFRNITQENQFPFFVATTRSSPQTDTDTDQVIGITYISSWRPERLAYQYTAEMSLFVHHEHRGKGIGTQLMSGLLKAIPRTRIKELLAVMAVDDKGRDAGLGLRDYYVRWGFKEVGRMERVGYKFERW
jgi:L-amino acid N-acyltransferase YncA